ncbi:MAG: ParB/RepB/Spo0J family partition protein [Clostridia bacterium]|nr:ParB/RepB/Spo0J family partition protein [Clostridia bacterium]
MENITEVKLAELHPFPDHPFQVKDDEKMQETVESILAFGVLTPILVRPREEGGYEIISGHRRKRACEIAGIEEIPVIIRNMDYDSAVIAMVDANIQREEILPSEKAAAYRMKLEAIKRQGKRLEENRAREVIAEVTGDSGRQVQRYIRLTELQPELMKMVDDGKMAMTPAVEISYLKPDEQKLLIDTIESEQSMPSLSQAKRIKQMSREGTLIDDSILAVMSEQKKPEKIEIVLPYEALAKYFPKSYTPHQMERMIYKLLGDWQKKKQRQHGKR